MKKRYLNLYQLNACKFLNELARHVIEKDGFPIDYTSKPYEYEIYVKEIDRSIVFSHKTNILNYLSFCLEKDYYYVEFNENIFFATKITKSPTLQIIDNIVITDQNYQGDTLQIPKYESGVIFNNNFKDCEISKMAKKFLDYLIKSDYSKKVNEYQTIEVPNTYDLGTHKEKVLRQKPAKYFKFELLED